MDAHSFKRAIELNRSNYTKRKRELIDDYYAQHAEYKVGDKVAYITYRGDITIGFIKSIYLDYSKNICYKVFACKKDGTPSRNEPHPHPRSIKGPWKEENV